MPATNQSIIIDPERATKLARIESLRKEYITLYTQHESMLTNDRDTIYCRYIRMLGKAKYDNFRLSVEVRALKMKVDLAQAAINHNRHPDTAAIDNIVRTKLNNYFEEIDMHSQAVLAVESAESYSSMMVKELKELYRVIVRRLHPDLHPDQTDDLHDIFITAQAAYRSYDLARLREIVKRLDMDTTDCVIGDESLDDTIKRLIHDVEAIRKNIDALRQTFPFNIESRLLDPEWVSEQNRALEHEREQLEEQRRMYAQRYELLQSC